MRLIRHSCSFTLLACVAIVLSSAPLGCTATKTVRDTLTLNDLQIRAGVAEDKGNWQQAHDLWSDYVERRPQSAMAEYRLGMAKIQLGMYRDAVTHLRIAHDLRPANVQYIEGLAQALLLAGEQERLLDLLRSTVDEGDGIQGYLRMARYARQAGLLDEAHEALELAIVNAGGQSPEPYLAMADFARQTGNTDLEIQNLRYALWFDRTNEAIQNRLAELGLIPGPSLAQPPVY